MSGRTCPVTGPRGSDDCREGDRVPEQYSLDCADCMIYTSFYCNTDEDGQLVKNPYFCDGRDGPEPRCFPKRVEGEKCHESWQCAPILDGDVYYPGMCNHHGRCVIFQNAYPLEC